MTEAVVGPRVAHIAAEHSEYVHSGGLGEVMSGLTRAQAQAGAEVTAVLPGYAAALECFDGAQVGTVEVALPWGTVTFEILEERRDEVRVVVLCNTTLFDRPGLYGDPSGPYWDNPMRFSAFARAAAVVAGRRAEIVHLHDWHVGLAAPHLTRYWPGESPRPQVVMTVHNLAFQGGFPTAALGLTGLGPEVLGIDGIVHRGEINPLKAGLQYADMLTTVSPTYAKELQTEALGWDFAGLFRYRRAQLVGILNGIPGDQDPQTIPRATRRRALCDDVGIEEPSGPLIAMVSRLTQQKGVDLFVSAVPAALDLGAGVVVLGTGERELSRKLAALAAAHPRVAFIEDFLPELADQIFHGSDIVCVPSRFEPCGLVQMHAMRAGALPLVRSTGGLADTVVDLQDGGWGFVFERADPEELASALRRAVRAYEDPEGFAQARERAMARPVGWAAPARDYLTLYRSMLAAHPR